ncbi:hypothetical protein BJ165DRAFT_1591828 [Panaeolus papilionaceus]|nr:hypothetical protein BJ165DRAFT_1591828 [Panaeolus papilionaceus]
MQVVALIQVKEVQLSQPQPEVQPKHEDLIRAGQASNIYHYLDFKPNPLTFHAHKARHSNDLNGNSASSEASAASTLRDEEGGRFLQTSIFLLNLALPIAEVFTPVKVIVGFLLESAKLLDKRNANRVAIKTIASRADDLIEALSTYAPEEGATSDGQLEASGILDKISQTIIWRISVIILKIKDLEKRGILRIEVVASALQDAKSELDHCVQHAQIQLSLYHGKMMQGLVLQMSSLQASYASTRRALDALQPSIQNSVACKTFRFVDMTGREHHVPCGVAFAEENFRSFLKEVLFAGQDTLSGLHKSLLQNTGDSVDLHSSTHSYPVDEETVIYMKVKRNLTKQLLVVNIQREPATKEIEASCAQDMNMIFATSFFDSTIDDILNNPLIHRNHIVDGGTTYKVKAILNVQFRIQDLSGQPYCTYSGQTILKMFSRTNRGEQEARILFSSVNVIGERPFKHEMKEEALLFFSRLSNVLLDHADQLLSTSQQEFPDSPSPKNFTFTGVVNVAYKH